MNEKRKFINTQKRLFIKINTSALRDIEKDLDQSDRRKKNSGAIENNKKQKRNNNSPVAQFLEDYSSHEKGKKKIYFNLISKNFIIDMTDSSLGSQMNILPDSIKSDLKSALNNVLSEPQTRTKIAVVNQFEEETSISYTSLKKTLKEFQLYNVKNNQERAIINIYKFIFNLHLYENYVFKPKAIKAYSEQDYIIKFWSYIIERIFSNCGLQLHWGDTQPVKVKRKEDIVMKIDLRILSNLNVNQDLSTAEFAKKAIPSKLYNDKLKQVLLSKFYLNTLLLSGLSPAETYIPVLQIMGFEAHFYIIRMINDVYVLENIETIVFPTSFEALKKHTIKKMIDSFLKIKNSCISLKNTIKNNNMNKKNMKMKSILSSKENQSFNHPIKKMVWNDDEDEEDNEYEEEIEDTEDIEEDANTDDEHDNDEDVDDEHL